MIKFLRKNKIDYTEFYDEFIKINGEEEKLLVNLLKLHNKYLTEGGAYYSGKTIYGVQKRFCPNSSTWVGLIYGCMNQIVKNIEAKEHGN